MSITRSKLMHFGAGALGLGLVAPAAAACDVDITVSNRKGSESEDRNAILRAKSQFRIADFDDKLIGDISISKFLWIGTENLQIKEEIEDPRTLFLTTSLKHATACDEIAPIVAEAILNRSETARRLCIIACENVIRTSDFKKRIEMHLTPDKIDELRAKTIFLECSVDRICRGPGVRNDQVVVFAEQFHEWIIEDTTIVDLSLHKQILLLCNEVKFVNDLKPYKERKLRLLNAAHYLIATHAFKDNQTQLNIFLRNPSNEQLLNDILMEAAKIFCHDHQDNFTEHEIDNHIKDIVHRFKVVPDSTLRILDRFKKNTLIDFVKSLNQKSTEYALNFWQEFEEAPSATSKTHCIILNLIATDRFPQKDSALVI